MLDNVIFHEAVTALPEWALGTPHLYYLFYGMMLRASCVCVCNTQPVRCVMCKILFSKIIVVGVDYVSNFKVNILRFCLDLDVLKVENS